MQPDHDQSTPLPETDAPAERGGVTHSEEAAQSELVHAEPVQPELVETGKLQRDLEALLFVTSEPLSIKQLAKVTGAEEAAVSVALQRIDQDFAHRGIVLREAGGGYRFASAPAAREAVEAYLLPPKTNLSPAALETLAIAAYMQPVTKSEIEGIRGVSADSVIATLVDRRFLVESGRKDVPGRPMLYKTTPEFLEAFGLRSLDELPPVDFDGAAPVELALPIPTTVVRHEATLAGGERVGEDELAAAGVVYDPGTAAADEHAAPADESGANPETEPLPSAV
ncbi:MAG TPA: SMC-Scp complex subunit ScpB [Candidatus Baltobacteraceae bacterium]|nr:SMC-Scp complex subunit ScpB [Candidatus Baltobacteraceae bacterium]